MSDPPSSHERTAAEPVQASAEETVGVEEARRRLPELLNRAKAGGSTLISRHGRPVAVLMPLDGARPIDPQQRQRRRQALLDLQGSGRACWPLQPTPAAADRPPTAGAGFSPPQLRLGDAIAFDGSALVAFLRDSRGTGQFVQPLLQGIAQGTWHGVISSLSLADLLQGPLRQGQEALAQRYGAAFADPACWSVIPADAALVQAGVRLQQSDPELSLTAAIELATAIAAGAAVLVSDNPLLARSPQHPVLSGRRP